MSVKKDGFFVPEEIETWHDQGIITKGQLEALKELYSGDLSDAVEYFRQSGLITDEQAVRIKARYIPDEITSWWEDGLISSDQYLSLRKGYESRMSRTLPLLHERSILDQDQLETLSGIYSMGPPEMEDVGGAEPPSPEQQEWRSPYSGSDLSEFAHPEDELSGESDHIEAGPPVIAGPEGPPEDDVEETGEEAPSASRSRSKGAVEKVKKRTSTGAGDGEGGKSLEGEGSVQEEEPAPGRTESFFRFNQLLFFISFGIVFVLGMLALINLTWEYMSDVQRGLLFLGISATLVCSGVFLHYRDFNRYLEVVTYHAALIFFGIGVIFLLVGTMEKEVFQNVVILVSLMIPLSAMFIAMYYRYPSIAVLSFLGYLVAMANSLVMWPEGGAIGNLILLGASTYFFLDRGMKEGEGALSFDLLEGGSARVTSLTLMVTSLLGFVLCGGLAQIPYQPQDTENILLMLAGLGLPLIYIVMGLHYRSIPLMVVSYMLLLLNILFQSVAHMDWGLGAASWMGFVLCLLSILITAGIMSRYDDKEGNLRCGILIIWGSVLIVPFIFGIELLSDATDIHTQRFGFILFSSAVIMVMGHRRKLLPLFIFGLSLLFLASLYHGLWRFEPSIYLMLLGPVLYLFLSGDDDNGTPFHSVFVILALMGYVLLWVGPVSPYGWMAEMMDPIFDWWKGGITLLFGLIMVVWGLRNGLRPYLVVGILFYGFSTAMAMYSQGDAFIFLLFLLTGLPYLFRRFELYRGKRGLDRKEENIYQNFLSLIAPFFFTFMWFVPVFFPLQGSGLEVFLWKFIVTLVFGSIYLAWGVLTGRRANFLLGCIYFCASILYISIHKGEMFTYLLFLLPIMVFALERASPFPHLRRFKVYDFDIFHLLYLIPLACGFIIVLAVSPLDPLLALPSRWADLVWYKAMFSLPFFLICAGWGLYRRSAPHFVAGSIFLLISSMMLSISRFEPFVFIIFILPILLFVVEGRLTRNPIPYYQYWRRIQSRFGGKVVRGKLSPVRTVFFEYYSKIFLFLGAIALLGIAIGPAHPLVNISDLLGMDHVYWKSILFFAFALIFLVWGFRQDLKAQQIFGAVVFTGAAIYLGSMRFELVVFSLFLMPVLAYVIRRRKGRGSMDDALEIFMLLPFIFGFIVLLVRPVKPLIDIGGYGMDFWTYKTGITLLYSIVLLMWGLLGGKKAQYSLGGVFFTISVLIMSFSILEPFAFVLLLLPVLTYLITADRKGRGLNVLNRDFLLWFNRAFIISLALGFISLVTRPYDPVIDVADNMQLFWSYKAALMFAFSTLVLCWGVMRARRFQFIVGAVLFTISTITVMLTIFEPMVLALPLLPILSGMVVSRRKIGLDERFMVLFNRFYFIAYAVGLLFLWVPATVSIFEVEVWSSYFYLFRSILALFLIIGIGYISLSKDSPGQFLLSCLLFIVTCIVMSITFFEPSVLLIFLIPLALFYLDQAGFKGNFRRWAEAVSSTFRQGGMTRRERRSPYMVMRTPFLVVIGICFFTLFTLVWLAPAAPIIGLEGNSRLWFMCSLLFALSLATLGWGLKEELRAHVLAGVLFIVVDGWILFLNQVEDLGVVLALFFTAFMFLLGGGYYVYATKRLKERD